uniref:ABC-2 type transporter domain-containing protein n=1 Tax=Leersia perrieri TaxID=77586 RepID=A0A0D9V0J7_9ORYZ
MHSVHSTWGSPLRMNFQNHLIGAGATLLLLLPLKFGVSWMALLKANIDRELLLMKRDSFVYIFKAVNLTLTAFLVMTTFIRTKMHRDTTYGTIYMGALYFALDTIMFNGFAELGMTVIKLPVFFKQRDLLFFPAWTYTIPSWILQIPVTFFEVGVYVFTTYYVVGFDPSVSRFFKQYLLLVALNQMSSSLFRFIAGLGRDMVVAQTIGPLSLLAFATLGGFILARRKLIKLLIVFLRERKGPPVSITRNGISFPGQNDTTVISVLKSRGIFTEAKWYWIGFGALIGYTLLFNLLYTVALSFLKPLGDSYPSVPEDALEEKLYSMIGFEWSVAKFFWYLFFMYFTLLYFTFFGMMAVGLTPKESIASIISPIIYNMWNLFSGYLIPRPVAYFLPHIVLFSLLISFRKIPVWWRWYCWICPVAWTLYGLVASQFGNIQTKLDGKDQTVAQFIEEYYGFNHDLLWLN